MKVKKPKVAKPKKKPKEPPAEIEASSSSAPPAPPPPPAATKVIKSKFDKPKPTAQSKRYIELKQLLKNMNSDAQKHGLTETQEAQFRELMKQIKAQGPEAINKELIKQTMILYNKSDMGKKPKAKAGKA